MTRYIVIDAARRQVREEEHRNLVMAELSVGLDPKAVDHGTFQPSFGYVVYEFGLFVPAERQHYWSVGQQLIGGNSVIYAYDRSGETVDIEGFDVVVEFFDSVAAVERAIDNRRILRPQITVNSNVIWSWPQPAPPEFARPA